MILLVQDTTDLIHTVTKGFKGLETLKEIEKIFLHPTIAITPDRWCRHLETRRVLEKSVETSQLMRSHHWLNGYQTACEVKCAN